MEYYEENQSNNHTRVDGYGKRVRGKPEFLQKYCRKNPYGQYGNKKVGDWNRNLYRASDGPEEFDAFQFHLFPILVIILIR